MLDYGVELHLVNGEIDLLLGREPARLHGGLFARSKYVLASVKVDVGLIRLEFEIERCRGAICYKNGRAL